MTPCFARDRFLADGKRKLGKRLPNRVCGLGCLSFSSVPGNQITELFF